MSPSFRTLVLLGLIALLLFPGSHTLTKRPPQAPAAHLDVIIAEVAWMGTPFDVNDEWIELYNNTSAPIDLAGWTLRAADGTPDITLAGIIPAYGYFLLERSDDSTLSDIPSDQIYTGALGNAGEALTLRDGQGSVIDTANGDGGEWPAGNNTTKHSMERIDPLAPDSDANWGTNNGQVRNGRDAGGGPIYGTPKLRNAASAPAADLWALKSGPAQVAAGGNFVYELRLGNWGNLAAAETRLTDTLPISVTFVSQGSPYSYTQPAPGIIVWDVGAHPYTLTTTVITLTGQVAPTASGTLLNQVYATTAVTEVTAANNLAWVETLVLSAGRPNLVAAKSGPAGAAAGSPITYTLVVSNTGTEAPAVRVTDTLPAGVAFLSQTSPYPCTRQGQEIAWEVGTLPAGEAAQIVLLGQLWPTASGVLTNVVTAAAAISDANPADNTATWRTTVLPPPGSVVINEVAWAGTPANAAHEWMELFNNTPNNVDLAGWTLSDGNDLLIVLSGTIPAQGYFLLERGSDNTIRDIPADQVYNGVLANTGEALTLRDVQGNVIDTANGDGGAWPAGSGSPNYRSMERINPLIPDSDTNWAGNDMVTRGGHDAAGNPINGTPRSRNSTVPPPAADLAVRQTGPLTTTPGAQLTYVLAISNVGELAATDVQVTDTLPAAVTFVSQSTDYPFTFQQLAPGLLRWTAVDLPGDTSALIMLHGQVGTAPPGMLRNTVTASTTATETNTANNSACWDTRVLGGAVPVYLPLALRHYHLHVLIAAVLFDGYQPNDADEAVALVNVGTVPVDLSGWSLCKESSGALDCKALPAAMIDPHQQLWFARKSAAFSASFGHPPDHEMASWWSGLNNSGDEVLLRTAAGRPVDAVVFKAGNRDIPGWSGAAVQPYSGSGNFRQEGQILRRIPDEVTGRPIPDTDTAADWMQYPGDPYRGRRALYPGWDLERFFRPLAVTEPASLTVAVAPDYAAEIFLQAIAGAQARIEAEFYELRHYTITNALAEKARQGVAVTLLLEGAPAGGLSDQERWACQQIEEAGGQCWFIFSDAAASIRARYANLHSKFMLLDRREVLVSSQNPTHGGLPADDKSDGTWGSRGVVVVTNAPSVVARLGEIFDADLDTAHSDVTRWDDNSPYGFGPPPPGYVPIVSSGGTTSTVAFAPLETRGTFAFEVISAPESALRSTDALLGLLARAGPGDTVLVEQMYEYANWGTTGDPQAPNIRLEAYIAAARRGATVRILLNAGSFAQPYLDISRNAATIHYVNNLAYCEGLDLRALMGDPTGYGIHNKMVLANLGGQGYAHVGSINGSESSSKVNREVALHIRSDEVYSYLADVWAWDWAASGYARVSEVLYNPAGDDGGKEWVEIYNPADRPLDISGWMLGDAALWGEYGSGTYYFPAGTVIPPGSLLTIAAKAQMVAFVPDLEFNIGPGPDDPAVPNMVPAASWPGFGFALGNEGDEVILQAPDGAVVDVLVYGNGYFPGVTPYLRNVSAGHSLERRPPERDTGYCNADFFDNQTPTPGQFPEGRYDCGFWILDFGFWAWFRITVS